MSCTNAYFNGWGECAAMMEKMSGGALQEKGNTWTDATIQTAGNWRTVIADDDNAIRNTLMLPVFAFENTTDDVEISTSPLGKKSKSGDPIPSGIIYLEASICDYNHLHQLEDTWFEFFPFYQDGTFWATRKADGTLKGFRCKIGTKAGLPPEDKTQSFPFYLFFDSIDEFKDVVKITPDSFGFSDLFDYSPVGLEWRITTAYTAGDVVVQVNKRGSGDGITGLVAGDFITLKSNAEPTVVVTAAVDDGLGQYTLTIKKDNDGTPANLAATDYVYLQAQDDDGTYVTYLAHELKVVGGV